MLASYKAKVDEQGHVILDEPGRLPPNTRVIVTHVTDAHEDDLVDGYPVNMLLAEPALREYWDNAEEDAAWKDL